MESFKNGSLDDAFIGFGRLLSAESQVLPVEPEDVPEEQEEQISNDTWKTVIIILGSVVGGILVVIGVILIVAKLSRPNEVAVSDLPAELSHD